MTEITARMAMEQSWMTAHDAMLHAKSDIREIFGQVDRQIEATLVAAYLNAAGLDYLAWCLTCLVDK